jgi:lipopolysaccharide transport system ATP-binding protein
MSLPIISVENLSKRYVIGHQRDARDGLRHRLEAAFRNPFKWLLDRNKRVQATREEFWALRDVSFDIRQGEVVGVIGRNGAGKSTLLKILSRITEPTEGRVRIKGRVASLLEVGTGFHQELTGRENIYLNGAILGMTKAEIKRKFDEIVAFSEIDQFLDTPVKRYSSGMYVRLAFAVAAHLEPEILIVDEVLAVGDAQFQKKCLGKMGAVAKGGRTVLFVSHNMGALANLCSRAVLLVKGRMEREGPSDQVVSHYISGLNTQAGQIRWQDAADAPGNEKVRLHAVQIQSGGETVGEVRIDEDTAVVIDFWNLAEGLKISTSIHLLDKAGVEVLASANYPSANLIHDAWFGRPHPAGLFRTVCTIPGNFLNEGYYSIRVALLSDVSRIELLTQEIVGFTVHEGGEMRREFVGPWLGVVRPKLAWRTEPLGNGTPNATSQSPRDTVSL